jgi:pilus assembly protein Flp/PilA
LRPVARNADRRRGTAQSLRRGRGGQQVKRTLRSFLRDESGATAIEYGLIAAGISVAIITVVQGLGTKLKSTFTSVQNALN